MFMFETNLVVFLVHDKKIFCFAKTKYQKLVKMSFRAQSRTCFTKNVSST